MEFLFRGIARAGGIEVAPEQRLFPPSQPRGSQPKARRSRAGPGFARRFLADARGGAPFHAVEALRLWRQRRAAVRELSRLSDHTLKDIGLHRGEIRSVVDEMTRAAAPAQRTTPVSRRPARRSALAGAQPCEQPC